MDSFTKAAQRESEWLEGLKPGDRVVMTNYYKKFIAKVKRRTKTKIVIVMPENEEYEYNFNNSGRQTGSELYSRYYIQELTDKLIQQLTFEKHVQSLKSKIHFIHGKINNLDYSKLDQESVLNYLQELEPFYKKVKELTESKVN